MPWIEPGRGVLCRIGRGVLNDKLGKFEQNLSNMQTEIGNIKSVQQKQAQTLQNEEKHHHNIEDRIVWISKKFSLSS
jgi:hypothetical protein